MKKRRRKNVKAEKKPQAPKGARRLYDCLLGAAIGDAIGVPYQFRDRDTFECTGMVGGGTLARPAGTWSDDTSLMLATADSIRATHGLDKADMRARIYAWATEGAYTPDGVVFDVDEITATALHTGRPAVGEGGDGAGSLVRCAPLAFTNAVRKDVDAVSGITHYNRIARDACGRYVHMLRVLKLPNQQEYVRMLEQYAEWPRDEIQTNGRAAETLQAALWCLSTTKDYASCVLAAVNLGGKTDTTACVAGALAGTYYGVDAIPKQWVERLRGKDVLAACLF